MAPAELAAVEPYAVQDHGELACQGHLGALQPRVLAIRMAQAFRAAFRAQLDSRELAASWKSLRTMALPHLLMRRL